MKKIRITVEVDMEDGEYDIWFNNISNPGESMDAFKIQTILRRIFKDWDSKLDCEGSA